MATLTITVPDAVVPRIRTAMGHFDVPTNTWIDATVVEVQAAIKVFIKSKVIEYESTQQAMATRGQVSGEIW
jgi:hypothetical protein